MLISVNGWGRDHGTKEIIEDDLARAQIRIGHSKKEAYLQVVRSAGKYSATTNVVISKGTSLRLNGDYVVHAELSQNEIARLFYLTHSDKDFHDLIGILAEFKKEQDDTADAEAKRQAAEDAKKKMSRIDRRGF
jgi:hypothetical protein